MKLLISIKVISNFILISFFLFLHILKRFTTLKIPPLLVEHHLHVKKVLLQLRKFHLDVNLEKCEFDMFEVKFLGFYVSSEGLKMDIKNVSAILD